MNPTISLLATGAGSAGKASAWMNIFSFLNWRMSTLMFLNTARESVVSRPRTRNANDCSFWLMIELLLYNCSRTTPGGETYLMGERCEFS